jgi:preprotein translocase subunit SecE
LSVRVRPRLPPPPDRTDKEEASIVTRLRRYIAESWSELKKVTWPTRIQVRNLTVLVFLISAIIGIFIAGVDFVFFQIIARLTELV